MFLLPIIDLIAFGICSTQYVFLSGFVVVVVVAPSELIKN